MTMSFDGTGRKANTVLALLELIGTCDKGEREREMVFPHDQPKRKNPLRASPSSRLYGVIYSLRMNHAVTSSPNSAEQHPLTFLVRALYVRQFGVGECGRTRAISHIECNKPNNARDTKGKSALRTPATPLNETGMTHARYGHTAVRYVAVDENEHSLLPGVSGGNATIHVVQLSSRIIDGGQ